MDQPLNANKIPEAPLEGALLKIPFSQRISFHTAKSIATAVACQLDTEIAICRAQPNTPQSFQNIPLDVAVSQGRAILAVVAPNEAANSFFFDPALTFTSSDSEFVESISSRFDSNNSASQMAALTDFAMLLECVSFSDMRKSPFLDLVKRAADFILFEVNSGRANHAAHVFVASPEATRIYAEAFSHFLKDKHHPNYNWSVESSLIKALKNLELS